MITKSDSYYLSEYCIPALLDNSFKNNYGPELIEAHSNKHNSSFDGSKPVARAHLEDSYLAAFLTELGIPSNKSSESINLSEKVLSLPDHYFFCFMAGLFAGDGCITRQKKEHLHLDFDLHCEKFCDDLARQIESRIGVPMKVYSHSTKKGKQHFKLTASTNWRALSLLFAMYYYAPFHLKRKTKKADDYIDELTQAIPSYSFLKIRLGNLVNQLCSQEQLIRQLGLLRKMAKVG